MKYLKARQSQNSKIQNFKIGKSREFKNLEY